jgi:polyisoprenoid-binding protein YceI
MPRPTPVPFVPRYATAPEWAVLAWSLPYGWYGPPPPDRSWLPRAGRYRVDPERSTLCGTLRSGLRRVRGGAVGVTGALRFGRDATDVDVDLAVETAGLHTDAPAADRALSSLLDAPSFPLLRFTAGGLGAVHGAWLLDGRLTLRGATVPLSLWPDPVRPLPGDGIALTFRGTLERRASGLGRRIALEIALVAVPEPDPAVTHTAGVVTARPEPRQVAPR